MRNIAIVMVIVAALAGAWVRFAVNPDHPKKLVGVWINKSTIRGFTHYKKLTMNSDGSGASSDSVSDPEGYRVKHPEYTPSNEEISWKATPQNVLFIHDISYPYNLENNDRTLVLHFLGGIRYDRQ